MNKSKSVTMYQVHYKNLFTQESGKHGCLVNAHSGATIVSDLNQMPTVFVHWLERVVVSVKE